MKSFTMRAAKGAAIGAIAMAMAVFGSLPAQAGSVPQASTIAAIQNTAETVTSSLVSDDLRGGSGCKSSSYLLGRVYYQLGKVTSTSVEIKSFDLELTGGKTTSIGGIHISRGTDGAQVWGTTWSIAPYVPSATRTQRYTVNKTVPATTSRSHRISLTVNYTMPQASGGEPIGCWGQGQFIFWLRPGTYTYNEAP